MAEPLDSIEAGSIPLDSIIDEMQAFEGVERDSLLKALYLFCDEVGRTLTQYLVPLELVKRRLVACRVENGFMLMEFLQVVDAKQYWPKLEGMAEL